MLARIRLASLVPLLLACRTTAEEPVPRATAGAPTAIDEVAVGRPVEPAQPDTSEPRTPPDATPTSRVSSTPYTPASTLPEPIAIHRATLPRPIFTAPSTRAPLRGRIEMQAAFEIYAFEAGEDEDGCSKPWAQVGESAWVCSKHTEAHEHAKLHDLPTLPGDKLLPFLYARHRRYQDRSTPSLPVYRHLTALRSNAEPVDHLAAYGTYAFVRRARSGGQNVLIDIRGRVVPAGDMKILEPSEFAGRDLEAAPVPADRRLAWVVHRDTGVHVARDDQSERRKLDYHAELLVVVPESSDERQTWIEVPAQGELEGGWIPAEHVRVWRPIPPPDPILAGQRFVDVDLDQQTLTLWIEDRPVFATLIASGKPGDSTPTGLYRIITKRAYGKMASLPSEPEPYWVDAVPWTLYFDGRFAFHGAFWHDRFGHRTSHGCVNLSPRDAKYLFDHTTPTLPSGWLIANEHASDPGTQVRIHKGDPDVPDRRSATLEGAVLDD